jgi:hypothetical protein
MSMPTTAAPSAVAAPPTTATAVAAPSTSRAADRIRVDDGSMRLLERAIALLAIGAAVLVSLAR